MPTDRFSGLILGTGLAGTDNADGTITIDASAGGGDLELITDTVLGSAAASITFSSISGGYKHLFLVFSGRSARAGSSSDEIGLTFNGDTGNNYDEANITGIGTAVAAGVAAAVARARMCVVPGATAPANASGGVSIWFPNYAGTTFHKTFVAPSVSVQATSGNAIYNFFYTGSWRNTAAITSITLASVNGQNLLTGTRATLYGVL